LVLIPFDLNTVDSSQGSADGGKVDSDKTLIGSIIALGKLYLADSSACRDVGASCLARLLTRPDMEGSHLSSFITWANVKLSESNKIEDKSTSQFLNVGILSTLSDIFKRGHRSSIVKASIVPIVNEALATLSLNMNKKEDSMLQRKLRVKLSQRIGLSYLPPRIAKWRYKRGHRMLIENIKRAKEGIVEAEIFQEEEEEEEEEVPAELEDVIELLLNGLRDKDTIVRWSAAKGVGRVTSRLPSKNFADQVVESVLYLFDESEGDGAWHGGCLALAEMARRGILLPSRLASVVPLIVKVCLVRVYILV
jgi:hypothetical protein